MRYGRHKIAGELRLSRNGLLDKIAVLERQLRDAEACKLLLAKLAADGPCFDNPGLAWAAKHIRDQVLQEAGFNPDGSFIPRSAPLTPSPS